MTLSLSLTRSFSCTTNFHFSHTYILFSHFGSSRTLVVCKLSSTCSHLHASNAHAHSILFSSPILAQSSPSLQTDTSLRPFALSTLARPPACLPACSLACFGHPTPPSSNPPKTHSNQIQIPIPSYIIILEFCIEILITTPRIPLSVSFPLDGRWTAFHTLEAEFWRATFMFTYSMKRLEEERGRWWRGRALPLVH